MRLPVLACEGQLSDNYRGLFASSKCSLTFIMADFHHISRNRHLLIEQLGFIVHSSGNL